jgi:hypothetical protein
MVKSKYTINVYQILESSVQVRVTICHHDPIHNWIEIVNNSAKAGMSVETARELVKTLAEILADLPESVVK